MSYSAVREMTRVATAENEEELIAYVDGLTVREVIGAMRGLEKGDDPNKRREPFAEPRHLHMELPPETYALFLEARRRLERETGQSMTDAEFMAMVSRMILEGAASDERPNTPPHQIAIVTCPECKRGWHDVPGQSIEVSAATLFRPRARLVVRAPMWARPTEQPADFAARVRATIALSLDGA